MGNDIRIDPVEWGKSLWVVITVTSTQWLPMPFHELGRYFFQILPIREGQHRPDLVHCLVIVSHPDVGQKFFRQSEGEVHRSDCRDGNLEHQSVQVFPADRLHSFQQEMPTKVKMPLGKPCIAVMSGTTEINTNDSSHILSLNVNL